MGRRYRGVLEDGIVEDFFDEVRFLLGRMGAGEFSNKAIIEDGIGHRLRCARHPYEALRKM